MDQRTDIWTYLIITAVAVLVWSWAAGETRVERELGGVRVEFQVAGAGTWAIEPASTTVTLAAEGSQRAIRRAEQIERLTVELPATAEQSVDLTALLRRHPVIEKTGMSLVSAVPGTVSVTTDEIVRVPARVVPELPGQTVGEIVVEPAQATVAMPSRLRGQLPEDLAVEAFVDRRKLDQLEPGIAHTLERVKLRLPPDDAPSRPLRIEPPEVTMTFTIRSKIRDHRLETPVRVQIAGPPEDTEYLVAFDPKQLRDVTVFAPVDVIEKIESGDAVVIAVVHLKSTEKEAHLDRKQVSSFVAVLPDGAIVPVDAEVGPTKEARPWIGVSITDR